MLCYSELYLVDSDVESTRRGFNISWMDDNLGDLRMVSDVKDVFIKDD